MASKFWVGGGTNTNWNSSPTTNWANTTGGTGNQTAPTTGDSVFFDGSSGTGASVWNTSISLVTLDCTGSKNVVTHNTSVIFTISIGNLVLPTGSGGTYTAAAYTTGFTFTGTSGTQQITTNGGKPGVLTLSGIGGTFQLQDDFTMLVNASAQINHSGGTFACQTFAVTIGILASSTSNTRAITGSGAWNVGAGNATGTIFSVATAGFTLSSWTSDIHITGTTSVLRSFQGAGLTFAGQLIVGANTGGGSFQILSANTFGGLQVTGPNVIAFPNNQTLSNAPTISGSSGAAILFCTSVLDTVRTLSVASGSASFSWCAFNSLTFSGGATFTAGNSFDLGHNSGITITPPSGGTVGGAIIGG